MAQKCNVIGCSKPSVAKGLCDTHRKQVARHGDLGTLRPDDWGDRNTHPVYPTWKVLRRSHGQATDKRWLEDFWLFAKEVPPKPENVKSTAWRPDPELDWGPDNFYWKESRFGDLHRSNKAAYMREWSRSTRAADPDYGKNIYLKKHYGVDLAWFKAKHAEQNGLCAICRKPETTVIKGKTVSLAVDHCHDKGHTRGLLCGKCNQGIGCLNHDVDLMKAAIAYLESDVGDLL